MYTNIATVQFGHIGNVKIETVNGRSFARVSVASKSRSKDRTTGQVKEYTDWLEWTFFSSNTVEFIEKYAKQGQYVRIEGKVRNSKYQKGNETVYTTEVLGFRFDFCQPKENGAGEGAGTNDDDIPFD